MITKKEKSLRFKIALIFLAIGLIIGVAGSMLIQNHNSSQNAQEPTPSVVFDRIIAQNELVCASQKYNITDKATDANTFYDLFKIPFTENSFWYRYVGTIKVGVNLKEAACEPNGNVINITLNQPYIISNTPNMDESGCLEENNNIFNPIHVEDITAFQQRCIEQSEADVVKGGIMDDARQNAEQNIRDMFYAALGDAYTINFTWRNAQ